MSTEALPPRPAFRVAAGPLVAGGLWTAVNLLVFSNVLDPLPDGSGYAAVALFLAAAIASGMAMGSWWALLLAVVPAVVANAVGFYDDMREPIPFAEWGIPLWGASRRRGSPARGAHRACGGRWS
ncbi:MAG: hypothetical protein U0237_06030 [Thermoleophilia bacterium]